MGYWRGSYDTYTDVVDGALGGRPLRFLLISELERAARSRRNGDGTLTVAQMVNVLQAAGAQVNGRASKVISDALRWEVLRGRVRRVGRGVYRLGAAPRSTMSRIRRRAESVRAHYAWVVNERLLGVTASVSPAVPLSAPGSFALGAP
jgi:hypothetical protein